MYAEDLETIDVENTDGKRLRIVNVHGVVHPLDDVVKHAGVQRFGQRISRVYGSVGILRAGVDR